MGDEELPKCHRCDEPIKPVDLANDWPSRIRGQVQKVVSTHRIRWTFTHLRPWARESRDTVRVTHTELTLCDGCWGDLLTWANAPNQERLKIAAAHRLREKRVREVAEDRRDREIRSETQNLDRETR